MKWNNRIWSSDTHHSRTVSFDETKDIVTEVTNFGKDNILFIPCLKRVLSVLWDTHEYEKWGKLLITSSFIYALREMIHYDITLNDSTTTLSEFYGDIIHHIDPTLQSIFNNKNITLKELAQNNNLLIENMMYNYQYGSLYTIFFINLIWVIALMEELLITFLQIPSKKYTEWIWNPYYIKVKDILWNPKW